jgi:aromatic ring-opening dioxygenase LigB subunit
MPFVGAAILPHGTMVLDKEKIGLPAGAAELHDSCLRAAKLIEEQQPELIVVHTPHGISLSHSLGVYRGNSAAGSALWMEAWDEFKVEVAMDDAQAGELLKHMVAAGVDAQGITPFAGVSTPLRWAETVPLWFLRKLVAGNAKCIILSQGLGGAEGASSLHRGQVSPRLIPQTILQGRTLYKFAQSSSKRVFVVYSGDLSHRHGNSLCPLVDGKPDPKYCNPKYCDGAPQAMAYDRLIGEWAADPAAANKAVSGGHLLLDRAASLLGKAQSCGFDGFVMLHGMLAEATAEAQAVAVEEADPAGSADTAVIISKLLAPPINPTCELVRASSVGFSYLFTLLLCAHAALLCSPSSQTLV